MGSPLVPELVIRSTGTGPILTAAGHVVSRRRPRRRLLEFRSASVEILAPRGNTTGPERPALLTGGFLMAFRFPLVPQACLRVRSSLLGRILRHPWRSSPEAQGTISVDSPPVPHEPTVTVR